MGVNQDGLGLTQDELNSDLAPGIGRSGSTSTTTGSGYYAPRDTLIYTPGAIPGQERVALYDINPQTVYNIRYNDKWTKELENNVKAVLVLGGYMTSKDNIPNIWNESATKGFLNLLGDANNNGLTYNDMFKEVMSQPAGAAGAPSVTRSFSISDPATARNVVNTTLNAVLGRDATRDEMDNFSKALRSYERSTPSVTTTTSAGGTTTMNTQKGVSAAGQQEAILGSMSKRQTKELRGVVDTQLGEMFADLLENA
jgi:hypothetical protein